MDSSITISEAANVNSSTTGKINCKMKRDIVDKLGLTSYFPQKINMIDVHLKEVNKVKSLHDIPWCLLQNILMLDYKGRNCMQFPENNQIKTFTDPKNASVDDVVTDIFAEILDNSYMSSINPVDVIVAIYLCASDCLRQILSKKLFMCNLSIPILLPNIEDQTATFLLWSLRNVIAEFKQLDGAVIEESVASYPIPFVSFVRLGDTLRSKSKLINEMIGNHSHSTFFHRDCENGTSLQYLSRGMIDLTWFLPSEKINSYFEKPVAFFNLHGDAREYESHLNFMFEFSHLICLLVDIEELNSNSVLSTLKLLSNGNREILLFISKKSDNIKVLEAKEIIIKSLKGAHIENIKHHNIILDFDNFGQKKWGNIRSEIVFKINCCLLGKREVSLEDVTYQVESFPNICIDEYDSHCQKAKELALQTLQYVNEMDLIGTKHTMLPLQGVLWKKWGKLDKMQHQKTLEQSPQKKNPLNIDEQKHEVRTSQCEISNDPPIMMLIFFNAMLKVDQLLRMYFIKWLEIHLDNICRKTFPKLHCEYIDEWNKIQKYKEQGRGRIKCDNFLQLEENLRKMENRLSESSFGIEHLMREVGQYYESAISCGTETYTKLPEVLAQMLLDGFPIELMDGDAMHVPIVWLTAVFSKLGDLIADKKICILSVLGLQSSGKSTLLNTMFGLQFSVSAGRCTRGVFAQLITMPESDSYDYILIVDTEGLRAPELGLQKHQHDNELATFVLGFGDVTIINMKGENPTEMEDILQICVHAFLRFKHTNKESEIKPCCILSHQNVGSVIAKQKIMFSQQKLKENLDSMTQVAATQEGFRDINTFNQVISFDVENNVYYFSDLWQGDPPMAPINPGYSSKVKEVKEDLLKIMKLKSCGLNTTQLSNKLKSLWNGIMREDFVFMFKNTSELQAYTHLQSKFVKLSWNIENSLVMWFSRTKQQISNKETGFEGFEANFINNLLQHISVLFNSTQKELVDYFESSEDKELIEQWKEKKMIELKDVKEEIIERTKKEFHDEITIRKMQIKQSAKLNEFRKLLELEAKNMANNSQISSTKEFKFENLWSEWVKTTYGEISVKKKIDVRNEIRNQLYEVLPYERHLLNNEYGKSKTSPELVNLNENLPSIDKEDLVIQTKWLGLKNVETFSECQATAVYQTNEIVKHVQKYGYVNKITSFSKAYTGSIIRLVLEKITDYNGSESTFKFSSKFKVKLLVWICHHLTSKFERIQAKNEKNIDKRIDVMNHKNACFICFSNAYEKVCSENAAIGALILALHETVKNSVHKKLLQLVVKDVTSHVPCLHSKAEIVKTVLEDLIEKNSFEEYIAFLQDAESDLQKRIKEYTSGYLFQNKGKNKTNFARLLEKEIIFQVNNIKQLARNTQVKKKNNVQIWIKEFYKKIDSEIPLSFQDVSPAFKYDIDVSSFQKKIMKKISHIQSDLIKFYENINANEFSSQYSDIYEKIAKQCIGCPTQCPLCGCLCSLSNPNHESKHQALIHFPLCVKGNVGDDSSLSIENCNSLVCGSVTLNSINAKDTEYEQVYTNWHIPKDESVQLPLYWKWFVSNYRNQMAKKYNAELCDIPESWKNISKQAAVLSLNS